MDRDPLISRRTFLGAASAAAVALAARRAPAQPRRRPPNLLFIHTDQQHWEALSAFGNPYLHTPNLDRLAAAGTAFRLSYSANPVCCPARSCWYTGRTASETGVVANEWPIDERLPDLGQWFGARGYQPYYAGKWHIPGRAVNQSFRVLTNGHGIGEHGDVTVSRAAEAFLRSYRGDEPFFLNLGFLQPHDCCYWVFEHKLHGPELPFPEIAAELPPLPANHGFDPREPLKVRRPFRDPPDAPGNRWSAELWRYYGWSYYRMVEMVDAEIGRVLDALEDSGHREDTLVVCTSDHGDGLGRHKTFQKMFLYDEAARVPLLISWPGRLPEGRQDTTHLVSGLDVPATLCDYAGIDPLPDARGRSLAPLLEDRPVEWREFLVAEVHTNGRMVRTVEWKLITYEGDPVSQLFELREDPGELHNRSGDPATAEVERALRARLAEWEAKLAPLPLEGRAPKPAGR